MKLKTETKHYFGNCHQRQLAFTIIVITISILNSTTVFLLLTQKMQSLLKTNIFCFNSFTVNIKANTQIE